MIFQDQDQTHRLKWAFSSCRNGAWGSEPDGENDIVCIRAADFEGQLGRLNNGERTIRSIDQKIFEKISLQSGDIILEKSGGGEKQLVGRAVLFESSRPSVTSNFLARCRPAPNVVPSFLNYLLLAIYSGRGTFPHLKQSTGIQNLDIGSFLDIRVHLPSFEAQKRIAQFLDEKTAKIDGLIEKKRELLDRLAEKRQALITQAVTKGLNPDAPMKPSGIEWLGDIPAHWEVKQIKHISPKVSVGIVITPAAYYADEGVLAIRGLNVKPMEFDLTETRNISDEGHELHLKSELHAGDLVAVRTGDPGTTAVIPEELDGTNCVDLVIIRKPQNASSQFLGWYLNSNAAKIQYGLGSEGALQQHFNVETSKEVIVSLPPVEEQEAIANYITLTIQDEVGRANKVQKSLALLEEYRAALITSAVTGQIEGLK